LAAFLEGGRALAAAEAGTVTWYAFRSADNTYGIFDTFDDEDGPSGTPERTDPGSPRQVADDLLAAPPDIKTIDVLAVK